MNNFLRGFGNFKKNENGIMEYVDYLGTKYTYDPTTKKWKSNGRILSEAALDDMVLSEQEGVGDAADDSGGGKKSTQSQIVPITSAIVGIADYTGVPIFINSAADYEVFGIHWPSGDMTSGLVSPIYRYGNPSFELYSIVPIPSVASNEYNGYRIPENLDSSSISDAALASAKSLMDIIPPGRKSLHVRYWYPDIANYTVRHTNFYKNTSDGTTYLGERVLTCWADNSSDDCVANYTAFLDRCTGTGFTFDYVVNDQEAQDNYYIEGLNSYAQYPFTSTESGYAQSEARRISAIVADDRFTTYANPTTGKTFAAEFLETYNSLRTQAGLSADTRSYLDILAPFLGVTGITNYVSITKYWTAYGCATGCAPDGFSRGGLVHPEGYNLFTNVIPAWKKVADNWHFNFYWKKFHDAPQAVAGMENVIHLEYLTDPVSIQEAPYTQGSNLESLGVRDPLINSYTGMGGRYYAGFYNIVWSNYNLPELVPLGTSFDVVRSQETGYVRNPVDDFERYNFNGYLVDEYKGPAGDANLVRYPTVFPYIANSLDFDLKAEWYTQYNYKMLVLLLKLTRHIFRSDPTLWQKFAPWIGYLNYNDARWIDGDPSYYHELIYHILLHGPRLFQIFHFNYTGSQSEIIHNILDEWRHISDNSKCIPCSNSTGDTENPVDRILLYEAFDNLLISGAKLENNPNNYIWRISVAPEHFVNGICTLTRQNNDVDLPETITIDANNGDLGQQRGVWIRRFTQGVPQYAVAGFNP
jgi:hypothetical protein